MPTFEIEQYEIHTRTYRIDAKNEAEAVRRLFHEEIEPVDGSLKFVEMAEEIGMPIEKFPASEDELEGLILGLRVDRDVIPSIRRIERIE